MPPFRPPAVRTDGSNAFARHSMAVRVPDIIAETVERNADYPPSIRGGLLRLRDAIQADRPMRLFDPPAPDHDTWRTLFRPHAGQTWLDTEWFFAEALAYRLLIDLVRYWGTRRDPFAPFKQEELAGDEVWNALSAVLALDGGREERLRTTLLAALWGNRMDLSVKAAAAQGTAAHDEHLLVDAIPQAVEALEAAPPGDVHVIMDNAGTEQALDFALADLLLGDDHTHRAVLHVKMLPVLVSDVVVPDVFTMLDAMTDRGGAAADLAGRLRGYLDDGRLVVVPDGFWNTAGRLYELPPRLADPMRGARLVIAKGDFNYRRATNDALWPPDVTFPQALPDFPGPLLALRTLKCDTLVGVDARTQARLDAAEGPEWRNNGTYGVAQFVGRPPEQE